MRVLPRLWDTGLLSTDVCPIPTPKLPYEDHTRYIDRRPSAQPGKSKLGSVICLSLTFLDPGFMPCCLVLNRLVPAEFSLLACMR